MIKGLQDGGVSACAKHFPGKGAATVDAHVALPTIRLPKAAFLRDHLSPFSAAVKAGVDAVMTSHVRFPALDSAPATFSRAITEGLLRERLGFSGAVISDDLCMGAVSGRWPVQRAALKALRAGHDMLMIAHDQAAQPEAVALLEEAVEPADISGALARVSRLLRPRPRQPRLPAPREDLALSISRRALEFSGALPLAPNGRPPLVLFPDLAEVRERFTFEGGPRGPEALVKRLCKRWGPVRLRRVPVESSGLRGLEAELARPGRVIFFCFEAMRFPGQRAALERLKASAPGRAVVCLLRGRWDRALLAPGMAALDAQGYRLCQLQAVLERLLGVRL